LNEHDWRGAEVQKQGIISIDLMENDI